MSGNAYFTVTSQEIKESVYIIVISVVSYIWFLINTIFFASFNIGILMCTILCNTVM